LGLRRCELREETWRQMGPSCPGCGGSWYVARRPMAASSCSRTPVWFHPATTMER
jgi:hypothetical protein